MDEKPEVVEFIEKVVGTQFRQVAGVWTTKRFYLGRLLKGMGSRLRPSVNFKSPPNALTFIWRGQGPVTLVFKNKPIPMVEIHEEAIGERGIIMSAAAKRLSSAVAKYEHYKLGKQ